MHLLVPDLKHSFPYLVVQRKKQWSVREFNKPPKTLPQHRNQLIAIIMWIELASLPIAKLKNHLGISHRYPNYRCRCVRRTRHRLYVILLQWNVTSLVSTKALLERCQCEVCDTDPNFSMLWWVMWRDAQELMGTSRGMEFCGWFSNGH